MGAMKKLQAFLDQNPAVKERFEQGSITMSEVAELEFSERYGTETAQKYNEKN